MTLAYLKSVNQNQRWYMLKGVLFKVTLYPEMSDSVFRTKLERLYRVSSYRGQYYKKLESTIYGKWANLVLSKRHLAWTNQLACTNKHTSLL